MSSLILFGIGKLGKRLFEQLVILGVKIDYICDNDSTLWNTEYQGIKIISETEAINVKDSGILISCKNWESIVKQFTEDDVDRNRIYVIHSLKSLVNAVIKEKKVSHVTGKEDSEIVKENVYMDLENGLVLGGVEAWVFQTTELFISKGYHVNYMIHSNAVANQIKLNRQVFVIPKEENDSYNINWVKKILENKKSYIICNFPQQNYLRACLAKILAPERVQLITIIHNDEDSYYDRYTEYESLIDVCFIISTKMEKTLVERGFPKQKIRHLPWQIPCRNLCDHVYAEQEEPIRLGYAGRIEIHQKRMDLMIEVLRRLQEKNVKFRMQIAGEGVSLEQLKESLISSHLEDVVELLGFIPRDQISEFWQSKDIMISCSDYEGHSISQTEAMAEGVVPVITDTSGARDDVENGVNGYVVEVGDVNAIVQKIISLAQDRTILKNMGQRAYETVQRHNEENDIMRIWESIMN